LRPRSKKALRSLQDARRRCASQFRMGCLRRDRYPALTITGFHRHMDMDPEEAMDTTVRRSLSGNWGVSDLLERSICSIIRDPHGSCWIILSQEQVARLTDIRKGPFLSVEAAMTAIEKNLNGPCRHHAATLPANYFP